MEAGSDDSYSDDEMLKRRRDLLIRRPSYRKILNELGGGEITGMYFMLLFIGLIHFQFFF